MIDRLTTALNLFPTGPVTEMLESIITAVKVDGPWRPRGTARAVIDAARRIVPEAAQPGTPAADGYYAIAADYEPTAAGLRALSPARWPMACSIACSRTSATIWSCPKPGVYSANGCGAFPIPESRLLRVRDDAGVMHTTFFGHAAAGARCGVAVLGRAAHPAARVLD